MRQGIIGKNHFHSKVNIAEGEGMTFPPGFYPRFPMMLIKLFKFLGVVINSRFFIFWGHDLEVLKLIYKNSEHSQLQPKLIKNHVLYLSI